MGSPAETVAVLHEVAESRMAPTALADLIADDAVFHSPVMHTPQHGKALVMQYLGAALQLFSQHGFHYVRKMIDGENAMLEFVAEIDGVHVNGVDIIAFDPDGMIEDFKVMVRPLKAIEAVRAKMLAQLAGS